MLTQFEEDILAQLRLVLDREQKLVLDTQLSKFNRIERHLKYLDVPDPYGWTIFHCIKLGRPVLSFAEKFETAVDGGYSGLVLATAEAVFDEGAIEIEIGIVHGRLGQIKYRSEQNIYYPPSRYEIKNMKLLV